MDEKKNVSGSIKQLYGIGTYGKLLGNIYFTLFYIGKSPPKNLTGCFHVFGACLLLFCIQVEAC